MKNTQEKSLQTNLTNNTAAEITKKKKRDAGIELLRYLLFMTILLVHTMQYYFGYGEQGWWLMMGVPTFFMITGWFGVKSTKSRFKKFLCEVIVYIVLGIIVLGSLYSAKLISANPWERIFNLGFLTDDVASWWFIYIMLFLTLISPYLNKFIRWNKQFSFWAIIFFIILMNYWQVLISKGEYPSDGWNFYFTPNKICLAISYCLFAGWISYYWTDKIQQHLLYILPVCVIYLVGYIIFSRYWCDINNIFAKWNFSCFAINTRNNDVSYLHYLAGVSSIIIFINLPKFIQKNSICRFLGKLPLFMYLFHGSIMAIIDNYWNYTANNPNVFNAEWYFAILLASTVVAAIMVYPIQYVTNNLYKFVSKIGVSTQN